MVMYPLISGTAQPVELHRTLKTAMWTSRKTAMKISGFGATIKKKRNPYEELLSMAYPLVTLVLVDGFFAVLGECGNIYTWFVTVLFENRVPQLKKNDYQVGGLEHVLWVSIYWE